MALPERLVVLAITIVAFGFNRAFGRPPARSFGSVKTALSIWVVIFVGGILIWSWSSHRSSARPQTLRAVSSSAPLPS